METFVTWEGMLWTGTLRSGLLTLRFNSGGSLARPLSNISLPLSAILRLTRERRRARFRLLQHLHPTNNAIRTTKPAVPPAEKQLQRYHLSADIPSSGC